MNTDQTKRLGWASRAALVALVVAACGSEDGETESARRSGSEPEATTTTTTTGDAEPAAAPETRIAFTRQAKQDVGQPQLWTGNIDGTDLQRVGDQGGFFPHWNPDRTLLVFDFYDEDGRDQIATIRPDGSGFAQLTDSAYNETPAFSPDGSAIIWAHSDLPEDDPAFATALWVMDADGTNPRPLLADPADGGDDLEPEYSPDGSTVVFNRFDDQDRGAVFVVDADGTNVRQITPWDVLVEHPRWSPDGRTIIYNIEHQANLDDDRNGIWTVPAAGGTPVLLLGTDAELHPFKPDYSPDGTRILFGCNRRRVGSDELCVMNADGTGVELLTETDDTHENHPSWT